MLYKVLQKTSPHARLLFAEIILWASLIGWPVSLWTFASSEPVTITSISWLALIFTAIDIMFTTDVRDSQEGD